MNLELWPLTLYFACVLLVALGMVFMSFLLGQRHDERDTGDAYESGVPATGSGRLRFSVKFYLIAMLFVIFDLEAVYIFGWAVCVREAGWAGYVEMLVFIGVLLAVLFYLWRLGVLDWAGGAGLRLRQKEASNDRNLE